MKQKTDEGLSGPGLPQSYRPARYYFIVAVGLFLLFLAIGYLIASSNPQRAAQSIAGSVSGFRYLRNFPPFELFILIFFNNSIIALLMILFGFFLGLVPLYLIYTNALLVGYVAALVSIRISPLEAIAGLLPHGIFELTGILTAAGYGLWLGVIFIKSLQGKAVFGEAFRFALKRYAVFVLPILFLAAFIEAFITPRIIQAVAP